MEGEGAIEIPVPIVAATITVIGGLVGVIVLHFLTLWRERRAVLRPVAAAYREAFANEVAAIKHGTATRDTLIDGYAKHRAAVTTAIPLLGKSDRARVQRAWDDYRGVGDGLEDIGDETIFIIGYSHPEFFEKGRQRFHVLSSRLDRLAT